MRTKQLLILLLFGPLFCKGQFREHDLVKEQSGITKTRVVYLTAVWCKPCMEKLGAIITNFGNKKDYELVVLVDQYMLSDKIVQRLAQAYDTSYFRLFPTRYYPEERSVSIKINPSRKIVKALSDDLRNGLQAAITPKDVWFGKALIINSKEVYLTKEIRPEALIEEIKTHLSSKDTGL